MHLYLSSYRIGDSGERLAVLGRGKTALVIRNALDFSADHQRLKAGAEQEIAWLAELGITAQTIDLRDYFERQDELAQRLQAAGMLWVVGGNTFLLRQAMSRSGLDQVLWGKRNDSSFVYGGYSAGVCVLSPSLKGIHLADEPEAEPVGYEKKIIWDGLGILEDYIVPHHRCDHFESHLMEAVADYYRQQGLAFRCLADGQVIIEQTHQRG